MLGRKLEPVEEALFARYLELLVAWQRVHRLVGSVDPAWIVEHVFIDSLTFREALPENAIDVLDLGSGAGVPGIPMRIVSPSLHLTMIEARERRVSFLRTVVRELALGNTTVIGARAETVLAELSGRFDAVVVRCAGRAGKVAGLALGFVRRGGVLVVGAGPGQAIPEGAERLSVAAGSIRRRDLFVFRPDAFKRSRR